MNVFRRSSNSTQKKLSPPSEARVPSSPRLMLALEPRILFDAAGLASAVDGDLADGLSSGGQPTEPFLPEIPEHISFLVPPASAGPREIVFVDAGVKDYQTLIKGVREDADVIVLDPKQDGVLQISEALKGRDGIDAVHIVSHGGQGYFLIGDTQLDANTIAAYGADLSAWGASLTNEADILIYGCDVAATESGEALLAHVSELTGADVAASTDSTGATAKGGDWDLEKSTGLIQSAHFAAPADMAAFNGLLGPDAVDGAATPVINNLDGDSLAYAEGDGALIIDQGTAATVTDADNPDNFNNGYLKATISAGGDATEDVLSLDTSGTVRLSGTIAGSEVSVDGTVVGTLANDIAAGNDLVINLNAFSAPDFTSDLLQAITYENIDTDNPTIGDRTIDVTVDDGVLGVVEEPDPEPVGRLNDVEASSASDSASVIVSVAAVNGAPVISGDLAATVAEGGTVTISTTDLTENDPDDSGTGLTYTVTGAPANGRLELSTNPGAAINSFTQDDLDNNRVQYVHDGGETTSDSYNFSLADGGENSASAATGTFNITVTPLNCAPVISGDLAATVAEGGTVTISTTDLTENDPDDSGTGLTYTVSGAPANGRLELSNNPGAVITRFTQDDLDNNRVQYVHDGGETVSDSFNFSLADGGENGASAATGTFNINVTPVNDAPVISNLEGDTVATTAGNAVNIDVGGNASVTDVDSANFDGGTFTITRTGGTPTGGFGTDGVEVVSGGDATFSIGETVSVNGVGIGTVTSAGQDDADLTIALNADATPARLTTLIQNLNYTKSTTGTDTFGLTVSEADGTDSVSTTFNAIAATPADLQTLLGGGDISGIPGLPPGFTGPSVPIIVRDGLVSGADAINPLAPIGFGFSADGSIGPVDIYMASGQDFEFAIPDSALPDSFLDQTLTYTVTLADGSAVPEWLSFDPETGSFSGNTGDADIDQLDIQVVVRTPGGQETTLDFRILFTGQGVDTLQSGIQTMPPTDVPLDGRDNGLNPETVASASATDLQDTAPKPERTETLAQETGPGHIPIDTALLAAISTSSFLPGMRNLTHPPAANPGFAGQIRLAADSFEHDRLDFLAALRRVS